MIKTPKGIFRASATFARRACAAQMGLQTVRMCLYLTVKKKSDFFDAKFFMKLTHCFSKDFLYRISGLEN